MPIDPLVFAAIIACAAGHALWNSLLKARVDPAVATLMLAIGGGIAATPVLFFTGMPDPAARPFVLASILIHVVYWTSLGKAYAAGDFGQVYPLARGVAPLLTALGAFLLVAEDPAPAAWLGILAVGGGALTIALRGGCGARDLDRTAIKFALITAVSIMGYSLVDGIGARRAGSPFAYTAFLYACTGWAVLIYGLLRHRAVLSAAVPANWRVALGGGALSLVFYGVGVWAMTVAPIALVAALRETSILFGVVIAAVLLHEPVRGARIAGAIAVCAGLVFIRLSSLA